MHCLAMTTDAVSAEYFILLSIKTIILCPYMPVTTHFHSLLFIDIVQCLIILLLIINAKMAVFKRGAGYLVEERRGWPVITASPRGQHSKSIQNFEKRYIQIRKLVCTVSYGIYCIICTVSCTKW